MRFSGHLDKDGRPFITLYVNFPVRHAEGNVDFLVDTGSDSTALNSADAFTLGLRNLTYIGPSEGVGTTDAYDVGARGYVVFTDTAGKTTALWLPMSIVLKDVRYSLLGRDIIQQFKMHFDNASVFLET